MLSNSNKSSDDSFLDGKVLLITGGTGSFGGAVLERFLQSGVSEIRIFSRDEKKQDDLRRKFSSDKLKCHLGDVRSFDSIFSAMRGVDYVFHAAALKQVPSCEFFPLEAVKTNVLGTENVLEAAIQAGVKRVVCLSTDKAVYPINAMGISKAMMEKVFVAKARATNPAKTIICGTRYGNVMASRGSVIPLFLRQILNGQPISITNPEMTRFMMTLSDAVDLVIHAFHHGNQGDVFVQKAPAATIQTLVEALKIVAQSVDHPVSVIGTRHGEKLYESLCSVEEMLVAEDQGSYFRIPPDIRDLNYSKYEHVGEAQLASVSDYNSHNTARLSTDGMLSSLRRLDFIADIERGGTHVPDGV